MRYTGEHTLEPARYDIVKLLAEFHGIDLEKVEAERREILEGLGGKS